MTLLLQSSPIFWCTLTFVQERYASITTEKIVQLSYASYDATTHICHITSKFHTIASCSMGVDLASPTIHNNMPPHAFRLSRWAHVFISRIRCAVCDDSYEDNCDTAMGHRIRVNGRELGSCIICYSHSLQQRCSHSSANALDTCDPESVTCLLFWKMHHRRLPDTICVRPQQWQVDGNLCVRSRQSDTFLLWFASYLSVTCCSFYFAALPPPWVCELCTDNSTFCTHLFFSMYSDKICCRVVELCWY